MGGARPWGRRKAQVVIVAFFAAMMLAVVGAAWSSNPWLSIALSLIAGTGAGLFLFFLVRILRGNRALMQAIARGDLDAALERGRRILATARTPNLRQLTMINMSAALYEAGRHSEALEMLDSIPVRDLRGATRLAYLNNALMVLSHADPERATRLFEEHHEEFESASVPSFAGHLDRTVATYRLMVFDDRDTVQYFLRELEDAQGESSPTVRSTCCYYLSVIAERNGDLQSAREWYDRALSYRPCMGIGPPPAAPAG